MAIKKVALFCDFFSTLGGTEYYNYILAVSLKRKGIKVKIFIGERPKLGEWKKKLDEEGIEFYFPNEISHDLRDRSIERKFIIKVRQILKEWNPDIIHSNPPGKMIVTWLEKIIDVKIPIVVTEWTMPSKNTSYWYPVELHQYINQFDVMISTCNRLVEGIRKFHKYHGRVEVIPHLIKEPDRLQNMEEEDNLFSVGCISRLSPEKGIDYLLGAWDKILLRYPEAALHIYGHGCEEEHLKKMAQALGIERNVFFEGIYQPITGIENIVYDHQIYVQPSLFESIPTSIIELLGRGRIVIATDVGGVNELVENYETGLLIPRASTDSIENALNKAFTDSKLRNKIRTNAEILFKKKYNVTKNVDKIIEVYNSLV